MEKDGDSSEYLQADNDSYNSLLCFVSDSMTCNLLLLFHYRKYFT